MLFFWQRYVERDIRSAHPPQKISKPSLFFSFFINQTFLVNIYAENTANLQNRAGWDFFGGVQPVRWSNRFFWSCLKDNGNWHCNTCMGTYTIYTLQEKSLDTICDSSYQKEAVVGQYYIMGVQKSMHKNAMTSWFKVPNIFGMGNVILQFRCQFKASNVLLENMKIPILIFCTNCPFLIWWVTFVLNSTIWAGQFKFVQCWLKIGVHSFLLS